MLQSDERNLRTLLNRLSMFTLGAACIAQVVILVATDLKPLRGRILGVRSETMLERSAVLAFGDSFNAYLQFLLEEIPVDATLVIPPEVVDYRWGNVFLMQFYFGPRTISNCPSATEIEACVAARQGENTYFLAVDGFPQEALMVGFKTYIAFDDSRGVYEPR